MNKFRLSIIIIIIFFLLFHLNSFLKTNNKLEILQINDPIKNYEKYTKEKLPIVIQNHDNYSELLSPLSIFKKTIHDVSVESDYCYHNKDTLILIPRKNNIVVNILLPKNIAKFNSSNVYNPHLKRYEVKKDQTISPLQIILNTGNALYIPRYWLFNVEKSKKFDTLISESPFSLIFTSYQIFPYLINKIKNI